MSDEAVGATDQVLADCEARIGAKLPESLKAVLRRRNGGSLDVLKFGQVKKLGFLVSSILSAADDPSFGIANIFELVHSGDQMIYGSSESGLVPFADNGFGNYYYYDSADPEGPVLQGDSEEMSPLGDRLYVLEVTVSEFLARIDQFYDGDMWLCG